MQITVCFWSLLKCNAGLEVQINSHALLLHHSLLPAEYPAIAAISAKGTNDCSHTLTMDQCVYYWMVMHSVTETNTLRYNSSDASITHCREWANSDTARNLKWVLLNFQGCPVHLLKRHSDLRKQLTLPWIILSHLHLLNTFCREPASPSFHGSFPEATFANTQHCGKKQTGMWEWAGLPEKGKAGMTII